MQLMRAREAVMQRFRPHLTARGLTEQQWRVIRALAEVETLEIAVLGEHCCIHPASLSRMLPKLAADGLVRRRSARADQRRVIVSLTARGRRLFAALSTESEAIYAQIARDLGAARLSQLYTVLADSIEALAKGGAAGNTGTHE
ncbi:MAG TPA: homoprotocatechuate degradation operon regulator HpaR [Pseudolabrys sp.]|nr:homoprotocatechuate degradation operon regulator HpaR [Pseudolabrys sp.]